MCENKHNERQNLDLLRDNTGLHSFPAMSTDLMNSPFRSGRSSFGPFVAHFDPWRTGDRNFLDRKPLREVGARITVKELTKADIDNYINRTFTFCKKIKKRTKYLISSLSTTIDLFPCKIFQV